MTTDKDREDDRVNAIAARDVWDAMSAEHGGGLDAGAAVIARIRSEAAEEAARKERERCAERAIAFVDNNYNDFGEWDRVAFDGLRAAILTPERDQPPDAGKVMPRTCETCADESTHPSAVSDEGTK